MASRMELSKTQCHRVVSALEYFQTQLDLLAISFSVNLKKSPHSPHEMVTINQMIRECHIISDLMKKICEEIEDKQTFSSMLQIIEDETQNKKILAEHAKKDKKADFREKQAFCDQLEEELKRKRASLENLKETLASLKAQEQEEIEKNIMIEQEKEDKRQMLQKEENDKDRILETEIQLMKERIENEQRSHKRSTGFLLSQQKEMEQQRAQWNESALTLRQEKTQQLNDVRSKISLALEQLMEKKRTFRVYEQVVVEDLEEEEKLRQEQERITAATKIQAFWRGCMVRKGFGIYKKTEDKKGKKKDGKKEGKKKKK